MPALRPIRFRFSAMLAVVCLAAAAALLVARALRTDPVERYIHAMGGPEQQAAEAQEALEALAGSSDLEPWRRALDIGADRARYLAAEALSRRKSADSARLLESALYDYSSEVRIAAVQALPHAHREHALRPLIASLRDEDTWVRERAATEMRFLKDPRTVPALIGALRDSERTVAVLAMGALRQIANQPWRASYRDPQPAFDAAIARWEEWWKANGADWSAKHPAPEAAPYHPTRTTPAPLFAVEDTRGGRYRLQESRGRAVLVHFWATWCHQCVGEMPTLNRLAREWPANKLDIVGLAVNEKSPDVVRKFAEANQPAFRVAMASHAITDAFGRVDKVPVTFLVYPDGQIRYRWDGVRDFRTFDAAIRRVLGEAQGTSRVRVPNNNR